MLDSRNVYHQHGRLRRNAGAFFLPVYWLESGGRFDLHAEDRFWRLPNTFPLIAYDARADYVRVDEVPRYRYPSFPTSSADFGEYIKRLVTWHRDAFQNTFTAAGKPFRYALVLRGPDANANANDFAIRASKDERDIYARTRRERRRRRREAMPGPLLSGADRPGDKATAATSLFSFHGRESARAWHIQAFAAAKSALDSASLPMPEILVTDMELNKDGRTGYRVFEYVEPAPSYSWQPDRYMYWSAWFSRVHNLVSLSLKHAGYVLGTGMTASEFLKNARTLSGDPVPLFNPHYYLPHPSNHDLIELVRAFTQAAYLGTIDHAIFQPAKLAFGDKLRCGEWNAYGDGRQVPAETRPYLFRYALGGRFGAELQIPPSYPLVGFPWTDEIRPVGDSDPRWNIPGNWIPRLQLAGIPEPERSHRIVLEQQSAIDRGAAANSDADLMPSTSVSGLGGSYQVGKPSLVERLLRCCVLGAKDFWIFGPDFNRPGSSGDAVRATYTDLVATVNGRCAALAPPRNRMSRRRRVSRPMVAG